MMKNLLLFLALSCAGCGLPKLLSGGAFDTGSLERAKEFEAAGNFRAALEQYERHRLRRREDPSRPADENPSFYFVLIGDMHLKLGEQTLALESYEAAERDGVEKELVSDRFRLLARRYAEMRLFNEAIALLRKHRALDPLMFDYELDQTHKKMIAAEDRSAR